MSRVRRPRRPTAGRLAGLLAALALAVGSLVLFAAPAQACSCVASTPAEQAERQPYVFVGRVLSATEGGRGSLEIVHEVEVDRVFKGEVPAQVRLASGAISASCGLGRLPDRRPLVFFAGDAPLLGGSEAPPGTLYSYLCDGTGPMTGRVLAQLIAALGEPVAPVETPADGDPGADGAADGATSDADATASGADAASSGTTADQGALLWPWLLGLFAVAGGAASYVGRRTT